MEHLEKDELLGSLRALELRLSTSEVTALVRTQPDEVQNEFAHWTLQISIAISQLERADLGRINAELAKNDDDLRAGTESLQQALVKLENAREIVDTLTKIVEIVLAVLALL